VHWGVDNTGARGFYSSTARLSKPAPLPRPNSAYNNTYSNLSTNASSHKRPYASAFEKPQSSAPRTPAPPPVPGFGNPLPAKPPAPVDAARKTRKKKRRHNQLGLTPKAEEHESSEEEDDVDEEAKLAQGLGTGLQFTYKGRTSTLQSSADIAAWIEERKKRFPTQTRIEERKKAIEDAKRANRQALEEARRQQLQAAQRGRVKLERKSQREQDTDPIDVAVKAKLKAEKLRRKLIKEEKRVARAEADAERARLKAEALRQSTIDPNADKADRNGSDGLQAMPPASDDKHSDVCDPNGVLAGDSAPGDHDSLGVSTRVPDAFQPTAIPGDGRPGMNGILDDPLLSTSSPELTDSSNDASSDSDLSLSSDSGDSDADSAPEEASSRRAGPERVAPPPRDSRTPKKLCRHFVRKGRCSRGDRCRFLHERPDGAAKARSDKQGGKHQRKGLLQMVGFPSFPSLSPDHSQADRLVPSSCWRVRERTKTDG
jgi:Nuclear fragile X mental retardation-interacting protein 1 (NUFIP1)/CCCH-type zinc finger